VEKFQVIVVGLVNQHGQTLSMRIVLRIRVRLLDLRG